MHKSMHTWVSTASELFPKATTILNNAVVLANVQNSSESTNFTPSIVESPPNSELDIGVNCPTQDAVTYVFELKITTTIPISGESVTLR